MNIFFCRFLISNHFGGINGHSLCQLFKRYRLLCGWVDEAEFKSVCKGDTNGLSGLILQKKRNDDSGLFIRISLGSNTLYRPCKRGGVLCQRGGGRNPHLYRQECKN